MVPSATKACVSTPLIKKKLSSIQKEKNTIEIPVEVACQPPTVSSEKTNQRYNELINQGHWVPMGEFQTADWRSKAQ